MGWTHLDDVGLDRGPNPAEPPEPRGRQRVSTLERRRLDDASRSDNSSEVVKNFVDESRARSNPRLPFTCQRGVLENPKKNRPVIADRLPFPGCCRDRSGFVLHGDTATC